MGKRKPQSRHGVGPVYFSGEKDEVPRIVESLEAAGNSPYMLRAKAQIALAAVNSLPVPKVIIGEGEPHEGRLTEDEYWAIRETLERLIEENSPGKVRETDRKLSDMKK